jgi:hypothetical protein
MKPREAFTDSVGDITPPVRATGRPGFSQAVIGTLRRLANVGHCLVFSPVAGGAVRCLLDIGNIAIGGARGLAYSERFHMADANRDANLNQAASAAPIVLPSFARRTYSNSYRRLFFVDSGIVDKFATAIWVDGACFYVKT